MSLREKLSTHDTIDGSAFGRLVDRGSELAGSTVDLFKGEYLAYFGFVIISTFTVMAIFAPELAPHDPNAMNYGDDGQVLRIESPTGDHWFGTTQLGRDVLSQTIHSARVSVLVGLTAAVVATTIGTNAALLAGYYGGRLDDIIMRLVDIAYGMPFLPFVIALVFIFGSSLFNIIFVISLLMWRSSARVLRSEVLSQKERPYVESAKAAGAGNLRIMYIHILPNLLPLVVLYVAFGVAWAVIYEASIAFLGFGDPELYSWGTMLYEAYSVGAIRFAWWWVIPPGICIMLLVMSVFFIGRALEKLTDPDLRH